MQIYAIVRKYKRKLEQQSWSEASMVAAVEAVTGAEKLSLNSAALQYGIPVATLYRRVKKVKDEGVPTSVVSQKGLGRYR